MIFAILSAHISEELMQILGRTREMQTLDRDLAKPESQFIAVYGRRRIGKTYLIREHFRDRFFFYHTDFSSRCASAFGPREQASRPRTTGASGEKSDGRTGSPVWHHGHDRRSNPARRRS